MSNFTLKSEYSNNVVSPGCGTSDVYFAQPSQPSPNFFPFILTVLLI